MDKNSTIVICVACVCFAVCLCVIQMAGCEKELRMEYRDIGLKYEGFNESIGHIEDQGD